MQLSANQKVAFKLSIVGLLIVAAVFSRFWLADWPNFKPVAAVAIFAGFLLGTRWLVWMVPLLILFISDWCIGFYDWPVMVSVYLSMLTAVYVGIVLARQFRQKALGPVQRVAGIALGSLSVSVLFFLTSNASVVLAGWYPLSWTGFLESYLAGLPFLRFTVMGDLLFTMVLFGSHFAILAVISQRRASIASHVPLLGTAAATPSRPVRT